VSFVLAPSWLPPGFSITGGDYVEGGLELGRATEVSASLDQSGSAPKADRALFALDYYGYHQPGRENIRLLALQFGSPGTAATTPLGGRHVILSSHFDPGGFVGNVDTTATWVEHKTYLQVVAEGITESQLARFVAGLREQSPPAYVKVPVLRAGTSQVSACSAIRRAGFRCGLQFGSRVSTAPIGTVLGSEPDGGRLAPQGSFVKLTVSGTGTLSDISDVVGSAPAAAVALLHAAGFVAVLTCQASPSAPSNGAVTKQTPAAGSPVEQGYLVRLLVVRPGC
jgi:hypothetical protein